MVIKKKLIFCIVLAFFLISCTSKNNINNTNTSNYISVLSDSNVSDSSKSKINIIDENNKILKTSKLSTGNYFSYAQLDDNLLFAGNKSVLSLDLKTGNYKVFDDLIKNGVFDSISNQGDKVLLINNIGIVSQSSYNSEVVVLEDLNNFVTKSFKTNNSLALDAIYINNRYYVVSRSFEGGVSGRSLEIYDENMNLTNNIPLNFDSSIYKFYLENDSLYLIGTLSSDYKVEIIKINFDNTFSEITNFDLNAVQAFVDDKNNLLYLHDSKEIKTINISDNTVTTIFSPEKQFNEKNMDYSFLVWNNGKTTIIRAIIRSLSDVHAPVLTKYYSYNNTDQTVELLDTINIDESELNCVYYGPLN